MKTKSIFALIYFISCFHFNACKKADSKKASGDNKTTTTVVTPVPNTAQKPLVLAAVKVLVDKEMTIPVSLKDSYFNSEGNDAYIMATMQKPDGNKMDFKETPFDEQANKGGSFSDDVFSLLKNENGAWKVKAIVVGATDVPAMCWYKEYKVSKTLFPKDMTSDDCTESDPFIFVDNDGRITLNGGIGLDLEELKVELVEALLRMDKMPKTISPEFADKEGGKIGMGMRGEIKTTIAEAIEEAKSKKK